MLLAHPDIDVHASNDSGESPLALACSIELTDTVQALLDTGSYRFGEGYDDCMGSVLNQRAKSNVVDMVAKLLKDDESDVNRKNTNDPRLDAT